MPEVSIVIRAKNEEKYIGQTLKRIFSQRFKDFEVIVVDSGSIDTTLEIVRRFDVKTIKIKPEKFTYGYALNLGAKRAKGKYIVYLSAHAIAVDNSWLENLVADFTDSQVAAIYGKQSPLPTCNPVEKRYLFEVYGDINKVQRDEITFSNSNSAIRKDLWAKCPFDEKMAFAEDIHWAQRVQKAGYKIIYAPKAAVYHSHEHSLMDIYRREIQKHLGRLERGYEVKNIMINLVYLFLIGIKQDICFCLRKNEGIKWLFFIPLYHLMLFCGRYKAYRVMNND